MFRIEVKKINPDFSEIPIFLVFRKDYKTALDVYDSFIETYTKDYIIRVTEVKTCRMGYGKKDV